MATPNMLLALPSVGVTIGPDWATQLNAALSLVDAHDHTTGKGVKVPVAGLNINAAVPFAGNAATNVDYVGLVNNVATKSVLTSLYAVNGNLYYNNGSNTPVQITTGSNVVAGSGSIGGMSGGAVANYSAVDGTYVWQKSALLMAGLDAAGLVLRASSAVGGSYITLQPPASVTSYTMTLPSAVPAASSLLLVSTSGAQSYLTGDNSTIEISGSTLRVKQNGITGGATGQIALGTISGSNIALNTVTGSNIAPSTITGSNISTGTVTGGSNGLGVATGNIAIGAIVGGALNTGGIDYPAGNIALLTITKENIAINTIVGGFTGNIALQTITGGSSGNIALGTITGQNVPGSGIGTLVGNIRLGTITGGGNGLGVATGNIAIGTITNDNIANGTIINLLMATDSISTSNIIAGAVTPNKTTSYYLESTFGTSAGTISTVTDTLLCQTSTTTESYQANSTVRAGLSFKTGSVGYLYVSSTSATAGYAQFRYTLTQGANTFSKTFQVHIAGSTTGRVPVPMPTLPFVLTANGPVSLQVFVQVSTATTYTLAHSGVIAFVGQL